MNDHNFFFLYTLLKCLKSLNWASPLNGGRETSTIPVRLFLEIYIFRIFCNLKTEKKTEKVEWFRHALKWSKGNEC